MTLAICEGFCGLLTILAVRCHFIWSNFKMIIISKTIGFCKIMNDIFSICFESRNLKKFFHRSSRFFPGSHATGRVMLTYNYQDQKTQKLLTLAKLIWCDFYFVLSQRIWIYSFPWSSHLFSGHHMTVWPMSPYTYQNKKMSNKSYSNSKSVLWTNF